MNRLKFNRCYLAGPMDRVPDGGVQWREMLTPFLQELGVLVLDPCNKPIDIAVEDENFRKNIEEWKSRKEYNMVSSAVKEFRPVDLRMVDHSDFIIAHWDMDVQMCGTQEEVFWANRLKRPILIHCPQGKQAIPNWLFGVLPHNMFFDNWDYLKQYLVEINNGIQDNSYGRWIFFNWEKLITGVV